MSDISHIQIDNTTYNIKDNAAARIDSPSLIGTPQAPRPGTDQVIIERIATTGYVEEYVGNAFKANDAMLFKGTIGSSGASVTTLPATHEVGWTYKVAVAGIYAGQECEVGDLIICTTAGTTANNAHWTVVQENVNFDDVPTENSINSVKSGGVYSAIEDSSVFNEASGNIVSFDDGIEAPAGNVTVAIEPVQSGTGDPSPENVRPITGWTGVNVMRTGKNVICGYFPNALSLSNNKIIFLSSEGVTIYSLCKKGQQYNFSCSATHNRLIWSFFDKFPTFGDTTTIYYANTNSVTAPISGYMLVYLNNTFDKDIVDASQLELGSTATAYEPYQGDIYNVSFGEAGTVYGGSLDVSSGKLTVDRAIASSTFGQLNSKQVIGNVTRGNISLSSALALKTKRINSICNLTTWLENYTTDTSHYYINTNGDACWIFLPSNSDNDLNIQVVYYLAEPRTYQLTPAQVTTLLGHNNILADTGDTSVVYCKNSPDGILANQVLDNLNNKQVNTIKTVSYDIAHFNSETDKNFADVKVNIEPVQSGTGDPSPNNVRPITGWTGVKVHRTRKNLCPSVGDETLDRNGITFTRQSDGSIKANGTATATANYRFVNTVNKYFLKAGTYIITGQKSISQSIGFATTYGWSSYATDPNGYTLSLSQDTLFEYLYIRIAEGQVLNNVVFYPMVRLASETDTTYEPYQGDTYDISFDEAGTVYGGSLDVTNGKLTVTHKKIIVPNIASKWNKSSHSNILQGRAGYYCNSQVFSDSKYSGGDGNENKVVMLFNCAKSGYSTTNVISSTVFAIGVGKANGVNVTNIWVNVSAEDCPTINDFMEYLDNNPIEACYPLATPLTYQLTPTEIKALLGENNVWADTGKINVTYWKKTGEGTADAIENASDNAKLGDTQTREMITQSSESAMTASKNYTAGNLIIINDKLLRATTNIATNGAITIGTNAEEVDLDTVIAEKAEKILVAKLPFLSSADLYNNTADFHNAMPRGKDITAYLTDGTLWKRINGTNGYSLFEDLYVGDTITADGQEYVIVDFDYYIRTGDSHDLNVHHLVMMPVGRMSIPSGTILYNTDATATPVTLEYINTANYRTYTGDDTVSVNSQETDIAKKWNATIADPNSSNTAGGYKYSRMRQVIMKAADTIVRAAFGADHVKPIDVLYPNPADASASGMPSSWEWFKSTAWTADDRMSICDLPNELQIYGQYVWGNRVYEIGIDKWQFSLFRYNRTKANLRVAWWLRSVSSATYACFVGGNGNVYSTGTSNATGVRPRFVLVG